MKPIFPWRRKHIHYLPWDVVSLIMAMVPIQNLPTLLLTCQMFRHIGEILLYRHIDLSNAPHRSLLLFRTLIATPYLARLVRTFHAAEKIDFPGKFTKLVHRLGRIEMPNHYRRQLDLRSIGNLTYGGLEGIEAITLRDPTCELRSTFTRARKVRLMGVPRLDTSYLTSLPDLTHLEIPVIYYYPYTDLPPIPSDHCPELRELIAPYCIANQMVPGRPVERLFLLFPVNWQNTNFFGTMTKMRASTRTIKVLGLVLGVGWNGETGEVLRAVAMALNDIEELYLRFRLFRRTSSTMFLQALDELLVAQPSLRVLDLNGCTGQSTTPFLNRHRQALSECYLGVLKGWKSHCPTLDKVVFPNGSIWLWCEVTAEWSCSNQWRPRRNRIQRDQMTKLDGIEPWTTPTFEKDLKREWPDDLVAELKGSSSNDSLILSI